MQEKINKLLGAVYDHYGVTDEKARTARTKAVLECLEKDREYFVVLSKKERGYRANVADGRPCKLVPLARSRREENFDLEHTVRIGTLYLMVTEHRVRLVNSNASVTGFAGEESNYFSPDYVAITPFQIPERLSLLSPEEIAVVTAPVDRKYFAMAFYAYSKMYRGDVLEEIPYKAERAMFALYNTLVDAYQMESGETIEGTLVPLGVAHQRGEKMEEVCETITDIHFCLLHTGDDVRYVIKTDEFIQKDDNFTQNCVYRFAALTDITEAMNAYY